MTQLSGDGPVDGAGQWEPYRAAALCSTPTWSGQ